MGGDDRESVERMVAECDVVTINCPLYPATQHLFDEAMLNKMKKGAYIVNTARGKICDENAIVAAVESGHLAGYAGDVWYPQPPPKDHPWRDMAHHAMTPHISGTSLSAQHRYCAGVRETLECFFDEKEIRDEYLIVQSGGLAGVGAHSYSEGKSVRSAKPHTRIRRLHRTALTHVVTPSFASTRILIGCVTNSQLCPELVPASNNTN